MPIQILGCLDARILSGLAHIRVLTKVAGTVSLDYSHLDLLR
jgi:hypothetical protein